MVMWNWNPNFMGRISRRKRFTEDELTNTNLKRVLSLIDLVALGVGTTLGAGAYVLAGQVAKKDAGPAVVISFLIAAVASMLAGLCYAEFGARVPKAGSAYVYIYVTVAEWAAFVIGWDLILEYVIGAAGVARTASGYLDDLFGKIFVPWFKEHMSINAAVLAPYADLISLAIILVLTAILSAGVKESATVNKIFTGLNLCVLSYVIIVGIFKDDIRNWTISKADIPENSTCDQKDVTVDPCGSGGFAPYGFEGIISGAATCFFAFVGFDSIATTGEEAKNPRRDIPLATIISLFIVFLFYSGISLTITMMAPYYQLDMDAPFAVIFKSVGWNISRYVVSVGAVCALTTSLLGGMFPLPRVILAMSRDGLLFKFLGRVERGVKTPVLATVISGVFAGVMAAIFDTGALVDMLSIGTLMAYTLVAASVLLLRYEEPKKSGSIEEERPAVAHMRKVSFVSIISNTSSVIRPQDTIPSTFSTTTVKYLTFFLVLLLIALGVFLKFGPAYIFVYAAWWAILIFTVLIILVLITVILISRQPQSTIKLDFKTPLVPFLPAVSMFVNIYLMISLDGFTWIRFVVWLAVGFLIYFLYGIWHSTEPIRRPEEHEDGIQERDIALEIFSGQDIPGKGLENGAFSPSFHIPNDKGDGFPDERIVYSL